MDNFSTHSCNDGRHAKLEWFLIFSGFIALCVTLSPSIASDGAVRFSAVRALLGEPGTLQVKFSLVQPVLSLPLAWFAKIVGQPEQKAVAYFNLVIFALGGTYLYKLVADRYSSKVARLSLLALCCASMVPHHLQWYFGEVLTSVLLSIGILDLGRRPVVSTLMFALALANTPALILPFLVAAIVYSWRFRLSQGWQPVVSAAGAIAIAAFENIIKYGSLRGSPYLTTAEHGFHTILPYSGQAGFSYPLFFGILSIVASFGKGLIFYIPGLLLFFVASIRKNLGIPTFTQCVLAIFVALTIALYAKWWAWYGGGFWGPRFFLFLCFPSSLMLSLAITNGEPRPNVLAFIVTTLLLSIWVSVDGYLFGQTAMDTCWANNFTLESLCWYTPEFSALWRPYVTGDIGSAWDQPRALFAFWQVLSGAYLITQLLGKSIQRTPKRGNENVPCGD